LNVVTYLKWIFESDLKRFNPPPKWIVEVEYAPLPDSVRDRRLVRKGRVPDGDDDPDDFK
jgi:hypothetical protein